MQFLEIVTLVAATIIMGHVYELAERGHPTPIWTYLDLSKPTPATRWVA